MSPQETTQAFHILLDGGQVGHSPGPQPICHWDVAIGSHVQSGLEFAFVHWRVVSKAKVRVLAIGIVSMHDESCQVIEDQREVYLGLNPGPVHNVLPDFLFALADGVQRPSQSVVVELFGWHTQGVDQHRPRQPIRYLIEGARRHQPVENQHHGHGAVVYLSRRRTVTIDDLSNPKHFQQGVQHRQGTQVSP